MRPSRIARKFYNSRLARVASLRNVALLAAVLCFATVIFAQTSLPQMSQLQDVALQGSISIIAQDSATAHELHYFLVTQNQQFELHFINGAPSALATGMQV